VRVGVRTEGDGGVEQSSSLEKRDGDPRTGLGHHCITIQNFATKFTSPDRWIVCRCPTGVNKAQHRIKQLKPSTGGVSCKETVVPTVFLGKHTQAWRRVATSVLRRHTQALKRKGRKKTAERKPMWIRKRAPIQLVPVFRLQIVCCYTLLMMSRLWRRCRLT
jgi:hypothetical protein